MVGWLRHCFGENPETLFTAVPKLCITLLMLARLFLKSSSGFFNVSKSLRLSAIFSLNSWIYWASELNAELSFWSFLFYSISDTFFSSFCCCFGWFAFTEIFRIKKYTPAAFQSNAPSLLILFRLVVVRLLPDELNESPSSSSLSSSFSLCWSSGFSRSVDVSMLFVRNAFYAWRATPQTFTQVEKCETTLQPALYFPASTAFRKPALIILINPIFINLVFIFISSDIIRISFQQNFRNAFVFVTFWLPAWLSPQIYTLIYNIPNVTSKSSWISSSFHEISTVLSCFLLVIFFDIFIFNPINTGLLKGWLYRGGGGFRPPMIISERIVFRT